MIRVVLPAHLRTIAQVTGEVALEVPAPVTQRSILNALEARYPKLRGAIRDHVTHKRRPFVRFFACAEDWSHASPDAALPEAVASGREPFLIVGAVAGGSGAAPRLSNRKALWTGRALSGLAVLFLLFDAGMKLARAPAAVVGTVALGYPETVVAPLGAVLLLCTLVYALPRTAAPGAILLTGYLGGAVATHVRVGDPLFTHVLFPVYLGAVIWGGLCLRNARLRRILLTDSA
jgi:hypothetical protein